MQASQNKKKLEYAKFSISNSSSFLVVNAIANSFYGKNLDPKKDNILITHY